MENLKQKKESKIFLTLICLLLFFISCRTIKKEYSNTTALNCKCDNIIKSFTVLEFRYNNKDTLIGPNIEWNDGTFEENEHILTLKTCTDLKIEYTPLRRAIRGYYILKNNHLIDCERWIKSKCPSEWNKIEDYRGKLKKHIYIKEKDVKSDTIQSR